MLEICKNIFICICILLFYSSVNVNNKYYHINMSITNVNMNKLDYIDIMHNLEHNVEWQKANY